MMLSTSLFVVGRVTGYQREQLLLLLFTHQVVSNSSWPHELQHSRLPCPSPFPRVCSNSCPLRKRQWQHTPVLLPGKSHGRRSLVGCSPWGREESETTSNFIFTFTFMHWRRKWQPTPVFLPGESQDRGSLVACRLWGHTELDTTEAT